MPDPAAWGWIAAGAVGGAFMFLLRWILAHVESDLAHARKSSQRGADVAEQAVSEAERRA